MRFSFYEVDVRNGVVLRSFNSIEELFVFIFIIIKFLISIIYVFISLFFALNHTFGFY